MCKIHIVFWWLSTQKGNVKYLTDFFLHVELIFWICWVKYITKINLTCLFLLVLMELLENFKLYMWLRFMDYVIFLLDSIRSRLFFTSNLISWTVLSPSNYGWGNRGLENFHILPVITQLWLKPESANSKPEFLPIILCCLPRVQKYNPFGVEMAMIISYGKMLFSRIHCGAQEKSSMPFCKVEFRL